MMANMPTNFLFVSNNIGKYKMQTADWLQNADYRLTRKTAFYVRNVSTFDFITYQWWPYCHAITLQSLHSWGMYLAFYVETWT